MKFEHGTVEKYCFRFDGTDSITINGTDCWLDGGHVTFILDTATYTLFIEGDWGKYCYRWGVTNAETFKHLLCRLNTSYLLSKISSKSEINWKETKKRARKLYFEYGGDPNHERERVKDFLHEIDKVDENEVRFYDFMTDYNPNLFEGDFFVKEYPIQAQLTAEIFMKYLIFELKEEGANLEWL